MHLTTVVFQKQNSLKLIFFSEKNMIIFTVKIYKHKLSKSASKINLYLLGSAT